MKHTTKRMTTLFLVLLMTASLLASCGEEEKDPEFQSVSICDEYTSRVVPLNLTKDEKVTDIIEIDGMLRATVGVTSDELKEIRGDWGIPYQTEHRYFDMNFVEDVDKREATVSEHEVALYADATVNLVMGSEPFLHKGSDGKEYPLGVQYFFYLDGQSMENIVIPEEWTDGGGNLSVNYNASANITLLENSIYAGIRYDNSGFYILYINDHFVTEPSWNPGLPEYELCGMIGIDNTPYALVRVWETNRASQMVDTLWETARLVPLTPETTELSLEGIDIDGVPTGGAFSDGTYGYFLCSGELWRTDGVESKRIADLTFCGINQTSEVRSVRTLSNGHILVVADGGLIELIGLTEGITDERQVFTIGVANLYGTIDDFSKSVANTTETARNTLLLLRNIWILLT